MCDSGMAARAASSEPHELYRRKRSLGHEESLRGITNHHELTIKLPFNEAHCLATCWLAIEELGWLYLQRSRNHLHCRETDRRFALRWPVSVLITVDATGKTVSRIRLHGIAFGRGPIANRAVERKVGKLAAQIEAVAQRSTTG